MAVSRMLKVQVLAHSAEREQVKLYLRLRGVVQVTDPVLAQPPAQPPARLSAVDVAEPAARLERIEAALEFLSGYERRKSLAERLAEAPLETTAAAAEEIERALPVEELAGRCEQIQALIRAAGDGLARSRDLVAALEPWRGLDLRLEALATRDYAVELWSLPAGAAAAAIEEAEAGFPCSAFESAGEVSGRARFAVIAARDESAALGERLKERGGVRGGFEGLAGTPAEIIETERAAWPERERAIVEAEERARDLAVSADRLRILADHYRETIGLARVEEHFFTTASTFLLEGWVRALDRSWLERDIRRRFEGVEISFRAARADEQPPIHLDNGPAVRPFEFVTTLYGRPLYREQDPTPLLAPFFVLFFALCLTDAGYGITLAALSAFVLLRFRPTGGAGRLFALLFLGGLATTVVGFLAGGVFGLSAQSLPPALRQFVLIDPLREPMKMLNIAFLMGIVHILFGMGVRAAALLRSGQAADALLDVIVWMVFLLALAPLGYAGILGGEVPAGVTTLARAVALPAALVIFLTGGRSQKTLLRKALGGIVKFYDVVGYFGDVLSYARLLALGLATSAIALAVNDIAAMVKGLPWLTGYVAMTAILIAGHLFNLAVNTLGAFVHSGRLQYLEFFSKFFAGGGKAFTPFRSERRYSVVRDAD